MGLFKKADSTVGRLPANVVDMMVEFGRFEYDPQGSDVDGERVWSELQSPLLAFAQSDPAGFVDALAQATIPAGEWAIYGASRTVQNLLDPDFDSPAHDAIREASLQFLRKNGVPNSRLNGYEWRYWLSHGGRTEQWAVGRRPPWGTPPSLRN